MNRWCDPPPRKNWTSKSVDKVVHHPLYYLLYFVFYTSIASLWFCQLPSPVILLIAKICWEQGRMIYCWRVIDVAASHTCLVNWGVSDAQPWPSQRPLWVSFMLLRGRGGHRVNILKVIRKTWQCKTPWSLSQIWPVSRNIEMHTKGSTYMCLLTCSVIRRALRVNQFYCCVQVCWHYPTVVPMSQHSSLVSQWAEANTM